MAPIRKKTAAKKAQEPKEEKEGVPTIAGKPVLTHERNDFLRQARATKKDKRETKRSDFLDRIGSANKVSKSSLRRQKRKTASNLKGNLSDLLSSLPVAEEGQDDAAKTDNGYVAVKRKPLDAMKSSKTREKVVREETARFNKILVEDSFKKSPFQTLRSFIADTMEKSEAFAAKERKAKAKTTMQVD